MSHPFRGALSAFFISLVFTHAVRADSEPSYLEPQTLTGTIYAEANLKQVLFTIRRTTTIDGSTIHVLREFNLPNGTLAARERVVYEGNHLRAFAFEDLQRGSAGDLAVQSAGGGSKMNLSYTEGKTKKTGSEKFADDMLVSDMVGPYIVAHWDSLMKGATVKCRLIAMSRAETVGFKFHKEADTTWHNKPVMMVTLEASSIIIAQLVDPMHFVIEKDSPHRIYQYTGRTTPAVLKNGKWEDLDPVTVFDWK